MNKKKQYSPHLSKFISTLTVSALLLNSNLSGVKGASDPTNTVFSQSSTQFPQHTTTFDGANQDVYVQYITLDGNGGIISPITDASNLGVNLDYTIMIWMKSFVDFYQNDLSYAFIIPNSFQCYFTSAQRLVCDSFQMSKSLLVPTTDTQKNQWTHLTVSGSTNYLTSYLLLETHGGVLAQSQINSYVVLQQPELKWKVQFGLFDSGYAFIGALRDFVFFEQYLTIDQAMKQKNNYLTWDQSILAYYRFDENSFLSDEFRYQTGSQLLFMSFPKQGRDYVSNDICYPFQTYEKVLNVSTDSIISPSVISNRWSPLSRNFSYTVSLWINTDRSSCYQSRPYLAQSNCNIILFNGVFMMFLDQPNSARFYYFAELNYYEISSDPIFIPYNQWINVQMTFNQYTGYFIKTLDMQGRVIQSIEHLYKMGDQQVKVKSLTLFQNLRGFARSFFLTSQFLDLPISLKMSDYYSNKNFLYYFKFSPQYNDNSGFITNHGDNNNGLGQEGKYKVTPQYSGVIFYDYQTQGRSTLGLISSEVQLFDGIACNDSQQALTLLSNSSYIQGETTFFNTTPPSLMNEATVEFWLKAQSLSSLSYIFSLYSNFSQHEFFSFFTLNEQLVCAPFGYDSFASPIVSYTDYVDTNIQIDGWFHLSCSYSFQNNIQAYLHSHTMSFAYSQSISDNPNYLPLAKYKVFIGNSPTMKDGSKMVMYKEVRIWSEVRSLQQISSWRHRQINPFIYSNSTILAYFRLTEASYREVNYESFFNPLSQQKTTLYNIDYIQDKELVVCPQLTYYQDGLCYDNPLSNLVIAVIPMIDGITQALNWNLTIRYSVILNVSLYDELTIQWNSSDPIINYLLQNQSNALDLILPSSSLIDQSSYAIGILITNDQKTFIVTKSITFIPISCQQVISDGSNDAFSANQVIQFPISTQDINFNLQLQPSSSGCNTFYNSLLADVKYNIYPSTDEEVELVTTQIDSQTLQVTIPKSEQHKLAKFSSYSLIAQLGYTNSIYKNLIDTTNKLFQNVIHSIQFDFQGNTVRPILTANKLIAYQDDLVVLNANQSFVNGLSDDTKYQGLDFSWVCPDQLQSLCTGQSNSQLSINFTDFQAADGQFNVNYAFQVAITWQNQNIPYYSSITIVWVNQQSLTFKIKNLTQILATKQNQFIIDFQNFNLSNINNLAISWQINPAVFSSNLTYSTDKTFLQTTANAFKTNTIYTLAVSIKDKTQQLASYDTTLTFKTKSPPYGGSAQISPSTGYYNSTNFTMTLFNWNSDNLPIRYQVWQTAGPSSTVPTTQISSDWIAASKAFSFQAPSKYPFIAVVSDTTGEVAYSKTITLQLNVDPNSNQGSSSSSSSSVANSTSNSNSTNNSAVVANSLIKVISSASDLSVKYSYMNQLSGILPSLDQSTQQDSSSYLLSQIQQDSKKYLATNKNGLGELVLQNSGDILTQVSSSTSSSSVISQLISILSTFSSSNLYSQQISQNSGFLNNIAIAVSNVIKYTKSLLNKRRYLQSTTEADLFISSEQYIESMVPGICLSLTSDQANQILKTSEYTLIISKLNSQQTSTLLSNPTESQTMVEINPQQLYKDSKSIMNINYSSLCAYAIYYKGNPFFSNQNQDYIQTSETTLTFDVFDANYNQLSNYMDLQHYSVISFQIYYDSFINNQTVCMSKLDSQSDWSDEFCTSLFSQSSDNQEYSLQCYCQQNTGSKYSLILDLSRQEDFNILIPAPPIKSSSETNKDQNENHLVNSTISSSSIASPQQNIQIMSKHFAFLGISLVIVFVSIIVPILAYLFDKRDTHYFQEQIDCEFKKQLISKVARISKKPVSYWIYKQDQVLSYNIKSISLFSHLLTQLHPFFNIYTKFDIFEPRIIRFGLFYLKFSIFSLLCILVYGPKYRIHNNERNELSLDQQDINMIIIMGLVGNLLLMPYPFQTSCLRSKQKEGKRQQEINNEIMAQQEENNEMFNTQEQIFKPQCLIMKYGILLAGYLISIASVILSITYSNNESVFNQYCMLASFYIGIFGSFFITNIIILWIQSKLVPIYEKNKSSSILRLFVSQSALRISQEIQFAREADKEIFQSLNNYKSLNVNKSSDLNTQQRIKRGACLDGSSCKLEDIIISEQFRSTHLMQQKTNSGKKSRSNPSLESQPDYISEKGLVGVIPQTNEKKKKDRASQLYSVFPPLEGSQQEEREHQFGKVSMMDRIRNSIEKKDRKTLYKTISESPIEKQNKTEEENSAQVFNQQ